jgi:hypothetical protein
MISLKNAPNILSNPLGKKPKFIPSHQKLEKKTKNGKKNRVEKFLTEPLKIFWSIVNHYCEFLIGHNPFSPIIIEKFFL